MDSKINPTQSRNGGDKTVLLTCGCDPDNARINGEGEREVFLVKVNKGFFGPLGAPDMGMQITLCAQCKEVMGFQVISTVPSVPPSIVVAPS